MRLGKLLKDFREKNSLSQEDLAKLLGVDDTYVSKIENGKQLPGQSCYTSFTRVLGISFTVLIEAIYADRLEFAIRRYEEEAPTISYGEIDSLAGKDRTRFLVSQRRDHLDFPKDRKSIPRQLCKLDIIEDEVLVGANNALIYGGLFVGDHSYLGTKNCIVIATKKVKGRHRKRASEQTKTFHTLHEVGHYQLHWLGKIYKEDIVRAPDMALYCSSGDNSPMELEANRYAATFLMPEEVIRFFLAGRTSFNMEKEGDHLCKNFFIEPWMLEKRLRGLNIRVYNSPPKPSW